MVEAVTARRLRGVYQTVDRHPLAVGGKTGTGEHRRGDKVVRRAAPCSFFLMLPLQAVATSATACSGAVWTNGRGIGQKEGAAARSRTPI